MDHQSIWVELEPPLRRYIRKRVRSGHDADDLLQEVMVRIQRQRRLPPEGRRVRWALRIAGNLITDHYRSQSLRQHASLGEMEPGAPEQTRPAAADLSQCMLRLVNHLPRAYREALVLSDLEGLTQQAVAERMDLSLSGAKTRIQRARQQLRGLLLDCCEFEQNGRGDIVDYRPRAHTRPVCEGCGS